MAAELPAPRSVSSPPKSAIGNGRRRAQAARAASLAWREFDAGVLHISTCGFYLENAGALLPFNYGCVQRMDLVGPGTVHFTAAGMDSGPVETFVVTSEAAELLFALWCVLHCPAHPQFRQFDWLPQPFLDLRALRRALDELGCGIDPRRHRHGLCRRS